MRASLQNWNAPPGFTHFSGTVTRRIQTLASQNLPGEAEDVFHSSLGWEQSLLGTRAMQTVESVAIASAAEAVIQQYFDHLKMGDFEAVSQLFAADGSLYPPFEDPLVGREAIAAYLHQEAQGIRLEPLQSSSTWLENGDTETHVAGKVHTSWFSVNVDWQFILTAENELALVKVTLLASLQELLPLKKLV